jgi:hypothetical protein
MDDFLERISKLSPRKLALLVRDLQARLDSIEKDKREPIAIVGSPEEPIARRNSGASSTTAWMRSQKSRETAGI